MGRDMYADLARIEERGKRKKKKGFLSFMGGKESGEEAPAPIHTTTAFTQEPMKAKPEQKKQAEPEPAPEPVWEPLKGRQLKQAHAQLHEYKKGLEKEFKAGKFSAKECRIRSQKKEVELGLSAPK